MRARIPIEFVRGVDEVTMWMWPDDPDPVTVRLPTREWALLERKAEEIGRDLEVVIGTAVAEDVRDTSAQDQDMSREGPF